MERANPYIHTRVCSYRTAKASRSFSAIRTIQSSSLEASGRSADSFAGVLLRIIAVSPPFIRIMIQKTVLFHGDKNFLKFLKKGKAYGFGPPAAAFRALTGRPFLLREGFRFLFSHPNIKSGKKKEAAKKKRSCTPCCGEMYFS